MITCMNRLLAYEAAKKKKQKKLKMSPAAISRWGYNS